jgi:hypothetical protein
MDYNQPDFIVSGFPKSGTTWLYERLTELPDFDMPLNKEIMFFDRKFKNARSKFHEAYLFKRMLDYRWCKATINHLLKELVKRDKKSIKFWIHWYLKNYNASWYLDLFKNSSGISGDISPSYCVLNEADVQKMSKIVADSKIILILRDPIDRSWSHFRMYARRKNKDVSSFTINEIKDFLTTGGQILRSDYLRHIQLIENILVKIIYLLGSMIFFNITQSYSLKIL